MPIISFPNKVLRLGYRRKQSRLEELLPRVLDKVTKHRTETSAIRQINNLMIDNYKLVDRKIFLALSEAVFLLNLIKSKSILIKTIHGEEI